jgi:hypothetical protein
MRVLVACEFSGVVRDAFAKLGHDAWSCDLVPSETPGMHITGDVTKHLDDGWDLMIAHPPCNHLAVSGARWFKDKREEQAAALDFVYMLMSANITKICVENPVSIISSIIRKPDQIIQPYQFGHDAAKKTCLWLKGLPKLESTFFIAPRIVDGKCRWSNQCDSGQNKLGPSPTRAAERARTYGGIALAMAQQWGKGAR